MDQKVIAASTENFDSARRAVCIDATYEIEALAAALPGLVPHDSDGAHLVVRGICARLLRLSAVVMSGLCEDGVSVKDLQYKVSGGVA